MSPSVILLLTRSSGCCCVHHVHKVSLQLLYTYSNQSSEGIMGVISCTWSIWSLLKVNWANSWCFVHVCCLILSWVCHFPLTCSLPHPAICYAPCTSTCALGGGSNLMLKWLSLNVVLIFNEGGELRLHLWQNHFCCLFSATLLGWSRTHRCLCHPGVMVSSHRNYWELLSRSALWKFGVIQIQGHIVAI